MHTASYEFLMKPKESARCHQTLSAWVGSGDETTSSYYTALPYSFHFYILMVSHTVAAAQNVAVPRAVDEMVIGMLPPQRAAEQMVAGVILPSSRMLRHIVS